MRLNSYLVSAILAFCAAADHFEASQGRAVAVQGLKQRDLSVADSGFEKRQLFPFGNIEADVEDLDDDDEVVAVVEVDKRDAPLEVATAEATEVDSVERPRGGRGRLGKFGRGRRRGKFGRGRRGRGRFGRGKFGKGRRGRGKFGKGRLGAVEDEEVEQVDAVEMFDAGVEDDVEAVEGAEDVVLEKRQ